MTIQSTTRTLVYPSTPLKEFKWTSGADVQATWRKYGWTPPSETTTPPPPPPPEREREFAYAPIRLYK